MGLFTTKYTSVEESVLSDETIYEYSQEVSAETGYMLVAEAEENMNSIMKAVGIYELNVLEATGEEVVYEANNAGSFFDKIKDFFKMIWEKIVAVFKKFFAMIDSWVKSDKDFVKKYGKELRSKTSTKDFEFKGYKFTLDKLGVKEAVNATKGVFGGIIPGYDNQQAADNLTKMSEDFAHIDAEYDKKDDYIEKARGAIIGGASLTSNEFNEELFMKFRNGEDSKSDYTLSDLGGINDILKTIEDTSKTKKAAEDEYKEIKKVMEKLISKCDKWKSQVKTGANNTETDDDKKYNGNIVGVAAKYSQVLKDDLALIQIVNTAKLQAIKDQNRQAKAICVKLLTYKPKNESVTHYSESGSFLDSVVLR